VFGEGKQRARHQQHSGRPRRVSRKKRLKALFERPITPAHVKEHSKAGRTVQASRCDAGGTVKTGVAMRPGGQRLSCESEPSKKGLGARRPSVRGKIPKSDGGGLLTIRGLKMISEPLLFVEGQ